MPDLLLLVGHLEGRPVDVAAVQRRVEVGRQERVVRVDDRAERHERQRRLGRVVLDPREAVGELDLSRLAALEHRRRELDHLGGSISAAPLTAPSPVTANWLAYVPEKPACEFKYVSWPGAHVHVVGRDAEDVRDDLRGRRLVALALRHGAERDDDLAEDVELHRRHLVVAGELELRVEQLRLAEVVRAGVERRADADAEQLAARSRLAPAAPRSSS